MVFRFRLLFMLTVGCMFAAPNLSAQEPTTLAGRITSSAGEPLLGASIIIPSMNIGVASNSEGRYALIVPASRATGQTVEMSVSMIGRSTEAVQVTLRPGIQEFDFSLGEDPLLLDEIVVIGQGLTTQRQKLGVTINTVRAEEIALSHEPNVVAALAGKAPNVEVTSSGGDPGAGSYIRIRGANSLIGANQPLFVVDGQPISNSSDTIGVTLAGVVVGNRAMDLNPADIESVQILKGAAAAAIYGSRAGNGVILITTKRGQTGTNRFEFRSSLSIDEVNRTIPLQTGFGQGIDGVAVGMPRGGALRSWLPVHLGTAHRVRNPGVRPRKRALQDRVPQRAGADLVRWHSDDGLLPFPRAALPGWRDQGSASLQTHNSAVKGRARLPG